jgi:hypothetical protein
MTMATNLDTDDFFQSRFFKAENDLREEGAEVIVTIKTVDDERVGREKELRPVLYFTDDTKPLILNKTNWVTLRKAFGPAKNWEGQQIVLFAKLVEYGGDTTLGTRVRIPKKKPPTAEDLNDEIPI